MIQKQKLSIRLSFQRQGNTSLSNYQKTYCNENVIGEAVLEVCKSFQKKLYSLSKEDILNFVDSKNVFYLNAMNNFRIIDILNEKYDVSIHSLERFNKLKACLSWYIKFNIIEQKKPAEDIEKTIYNTFNSMMNTFSAIKRMVPENLQFKYENLYIDKKLNQSYFNHICNLTGLSRNNKEMIITEQPNVLTINDYIKYIDEDLLHRLEKNTGFNLE
jgi:hypothetical protein